MNEAMRDFYPNTPEEDEAINRGIAMEPDTFEITPEMLAQTRPFMDRFKNKSSAEQPKAPC